MGDSAETLRALIPLLTRKTDRSWRETIDKNIADWWKVLEARAKSWRLEAGGVTKWGENSAANYAAYYATGVAGTSR